MSRQEESLAFDLALRRIRGLSSKIMLDLIRHFGVAEDVLNAGSADLCQVEGVTSKILRQIKKPDWHGVERDLAWLRQPGCAVIRYQDSSYPVRLKEIFDPPPLLFVRGSIELLGRRQISMVGSRRPTAAGRQICFHLAQELSQEDFVITSGLALGIDAMSHQGALEAGGRTLAVLGNGLDKIYPHKHQALAEKILESGAIISEFPIGIPPMKQNFPARNRVISGLGEGTVVVEAAKRSGSMITARLAAEQGREVFAVPGSILSPLSEGCHWLIKQGAKLTEGSTDILEELQSDSSFPVGNKASVEKGLTATLLTADADSKYQSLLNAMGYEPVTAEKLVQTSGLTAAEVSSMLLNMEIDGVLVSQLDGTFMRVKK